MKKIIRLTESDFTRIIKRIINENQCLEPPQILLDYKIGSSKFEYVCNKYNLIYNFASYTKDETKFGFVIYIELERKKGMLQFDRTNLNNNLTSVIDNLKSTLGGEFIGPRGSFDVGDNKARFNFTFEDDADLETKLNAIKSQLNPLLTESNLTRIIKRVIKENEIEENWLSKRFKKNKSTPIKTIRKDISDFTSKELEKIWENVVRYVSPGFFEKDEAENYLLYDVTDGDRDLYNSIVDWFEESGKDEDIIRLLKTGIW